MSYFVFNRKREACTGLEKLERTRKLCDGKTIPSAPIYTALAVVRLHKIFQDQQNAESFCENM